MLVRRRGPLDVEACLSALREVRACDGYPSAPADAAFLLPPDEVASWVAVSHGEVVGHVALHSPSTSATVEAARAATGRPAAEHVVLSRLFVTPRARRSGAARTLLAVAVEAARARGQRAVLDVGQGFTAAVALYEAQGWVRVASGRQAVGAETFAVFVYVAPDAAGGGEPPSADLDAHRQAGTAAAAERSRARLT